MPDGEIISPMSPLKFACRVTGRIAMVMFGCAAVLLLMTPSPRLALLVVAPQSILLVGSFWYLKTIFVVFQKVEKSARRTLERFKEWFANDHVLREPCDSDYSALDLSGYDEKANWLTAAGYHPLGAFIDVTADKVLGGRKRDGCAFPIRAFFGSHATVRRTTSRLQGKNFHVLNRGLGDPIFENGRQLPRR